MVDPVIVLKTSQIGSLLHLIFAHFISCKFISKQYQLMMNRHCSKAHDLAIQVNMKYHTIAEALKTITARAVVTIYM